MKKVCFNLLYAVTAIVVVINTFMSIKTSIFFDIEDLPKGEKIYSVSSPDGDRKLTMYLVSNNLGTAVRGSVDDKNGSRNVFWQTDIESIKASWLNNNVIIINDMELDVSKGGNYDCRRGISLFQEGAVDEGIAESEK